MKIKRHKKILQLISDEIIATQDELTKRLVDASFNVTQATVSRDIKELALIKIADTDGYRYSAPKAVGQNRIMGTKFYSLVKENATIVDYAVNTVVIKSFAGLANAICASIDAMNRDNIVGTIAGDDTIFVLLRTEQMARKFYDELQDILYD